LSKCNICGAPIFADEPVTNQPCLDCIMEPLPDLIDKIVTMLIRADGDRDHMNHSDITCEQSMAIVEVLRMCKSALQADDLAEQVGRLADEMGHNV